MRRRGLARAAVAAAAMAAVLGCAHAGRAAPPGPAGVALPWSAATCRAAATDADRDGLDDGCEFALARAFAPELVVDRRDCLWTDAAPAPRLGGGYLFAVEPVGGGVRIAYLPAYFRDCGWRGPVCRLKRSGCGAHDGDSEFILVDVVPDDRAGTGPTRWRAAGVFLSAHCFGRAGGRCRWYRGGALGKFAWAGETPFGAPRVWVARGKHAGYPSRAACDRGHWDYDTCDRNDAAVRFPVLLARQNVGSRAHPLPAAGGCLTRDALPLGPAGADAGTREGVWDAGRPFRGWQAGNVGPAPTAYGRALARVAGL